ncbi:FUSC family protein [Acetobacter cibinongensis]|uniref:Fusaric acid resistance protein n=1 Tax=Acetobacter cibinongensis TaxID=146475 RepID=A0A1Z5YWE2_9PROT|nr:FUSC family protein [Acetobacter cibinongensis]OUJ03335.1 fusaric acid resistance protein [Acetobacter cibinongensis]
MAQPVPDSIHLTAARFWRLLWDPAPGRSGYALRMAGACAVVILVCEIWQVPESAVPALVTVAVWQKDRVTNVLAGVALNILIALVILLLFGLVHLTLDHPMAIVMATALLSFLFFFLGSASKLKPVAYLLALVIVYAMIAIDQAPIGEVATRAMLYADLFILVPGATMVVLGLLICPSPKTLLTQEIAARLRLSLALLQHPTPALQEQATDMLRTGADSMLKYLKLAGLEKLWRKDDLACLHQAIYSSVATLTLTQALTRGNQNTAPPQEFLLTLSEMADCFSKGSYPLDITLPETPAEFAELRTILTQFCCFDTGRDIERVEKSFKQKSGFLFPDAFTNPEHVRFAVKGTAAVMCSYFLFKVLNWPGIHTCVITCFIVALPTMGEMVSKLTLRISGALVGGAMGIGSIIVFMPHLHTIVAFLCMMSAGALLASWVKTGDERISYAGLQIALAFFLSDLKSYGPTTDMTTARDRIIGILIGNFITYAVFTTFWPSSAYTKLAKPFADVFAGLKKMCTTHNLTERLVLLARTQTALAKAERTMEFASLEPAHMRAGMTHFNAYHAAARQVEQSFETLLVTPEDPAHLTRVTSLEQSVLS